MPSSAAAAPPLCLASLRIAAAARMTPQLPPLTPPARAGACPGLQRDSETLLSSLLPRVVQDRPTVPVFSPAKVPGCDIDLLYPYDQLCESPTVTAPAPPWNERKPVVLWRGSSTGRGTYRRSSSRKGQRRAVLWTDGGGAGAEPRVAVNHRFRIVRALWGKADFDVAIYGDGGLDMPRDAERAGLGLAELRDRWVKPGKIPMEEWSRHKYFLSLPGNSYSNKDVWTIQLNGTFIYLNRNDDAFSRSLVNGTHFLRYPLDLEGLEEGVAWLRTHDQEARAMGLALREHFETRWRRAGQAKYMAALLHVYGRVVKFIED